MITVDYEYYRDSYGGEAVKPCELDALVRDAQNTLIQLSGGAFLRFEFEDESIVKDCLCALADYGHAEEIRLAKSGVASESVGGHSRSYNTQAYAKTAAEILSDKKNIAFAYLLRTGLFYRGVL